MAKFLDQEGLKALWAKIKDYAATSDDVSEALKSYTTSTALVELLNDYESKKELEETLANYATSSDLEEVQSKLDETVKELEDKVAAEVTKVFTFKGSVDTYAELPTENEVGDVYNVVAADEANGIKAGDNVVWTGDSWDNLSGIVDLSAYATKDYVDTGLANKTTQSIKSDNGEARIENEVTGGGAKFIHNDGTASYVGVNDGGKDGMVAQIYADIETDGKWIGSRLNVYQKGMFYHNAEDKASADYVADDPDHEIAVKKDIENVIAGSVVSISSDEINEICV